MNEPLDLSEAGEIFPVIRELVVTGNPQCSRKVNEAIDRGELTVRDLKQCMITARGIHKAEKDDLGMALDGRKYFIIGRGSYGQRVYTCGRIFLTPEGHRAYFFITAHEANEKD
ncbi:MAG TPA: hypothetical protein VGL40_00070 [Bacillota bacterium]|jgi:hypothetical protein